MSDDRSVGDVAFQLAEAIKDALFIEPDAAREETRVDFCKQAAEAVLALMVAHEELAGQ